MEALQDAGMICFFTGAGISTESGIPDFRSPGGIWSQYRIIEFSEFVASEEARLEDWDRRFHMSDVFEESAPNHAHYLISDLIADGTASGVITQNIDGLHERSGVPSGKVVNFHGSGAYAHCLNCERQYSILNCKDIIDKTGRSPVCDCGGLIKAAVVSFGETIPEDFLHRAISLVDSANTLIAIGSSLQVWPAAGLLERAVHNGAQLFVINNTATPFDKDAGLVLRAKVAELTENAYELLKVRRQSGPSPK
ncbi:MAG: Sir2 family NAD-dependent protein deacetylase [Pseudomonadota bacterium]